MGLSVVVVGAAAGAVSPGTSLTASRSTPDDADPDASSGERRGAAHTSRRDVLELVALGLSNHAIAARLGISDHTVKVHLASIFGKLDVTTRTGAVRRGLTRGLITV